MTRVLLIEQDPDFAACLRRILEADGFEVAWTETITDAVSRLNEIEASVSIVNLSENIEIIPDNISQLINAGTDLAVLVTTNYQNPELAGAALNAGAHDYLLKPFSTREILERTRSLAELSNNNSETGSSEIATKIHLAGFLDDTLRITLDQLCGTLHLSECLIALHNGTDFTVAASRGYRPDPVSRRISLVDEAINDLFVSLRANNFIPAEIVQNITSALDIDKHRAFPVILPLTTESTSGCDNICGFIMGHGSYVLDEYDILEMELYLSRISRDLSVLAGQLGILNSIDTQIIEGEFIIPQTDREYATNYILTAASGHLSYKNDLFWMRLVMDEAVNNAILHGHNEPMDNPVQSVRIKFSVSSKRIILTVEDSGHGFDYRSIPDPTADENLMNINGRGIFLMRAIMDEVVFSGTGNRITLVKNIDGKPLGPFSSRENDFEFW